MKNKKIIIYLEIGLIISSIVVKGIELINNKKIKIESDLVQKSYEDIIFFDTPQMLVDGKVLDINVPQGCEYIGNGKMINKNAKKYYEYIYPENEDLYEYNIPQGYEYAGNKVVKKIKRIK